MSVAEQFPFSPLAEGQPAPATNLTAENVGVYGSVWLHGLVQNGERETLVTISYRPGKADTSSGADKLFIASVAETHEWDIQYVRDVVDGVEQGRHDRQVYVLRREFEDESGVCRAEFGKLIVNRQFWRVETQELNGSCSAAPEVPRPARLGCEIVRLVAATI